MRGSADADSRCIRLDRAFKMMLAQDVVRNHKNVQIVIPIIDPSCYLKNLQFDKIKFVNFFPQSKSVIYITEMGQGEVFENDQIAPDHLTDTNKKLINSIFGEKEDKVEQSASCPSCYIQWMIGIGPRSELSSPDLSNSDIKTAPAVTKTIYNHEDPNEFPIKFYYKYYVDMRYSPWKLRLFSLNPCPPANFTIPTTVVYENSSTTETLNLVGRTVELGCPYHYDVNCFYNAFIFEANIYKVPKSLEVHIGRRKIEFQHSKIVRKEKKKGLTIIVAPMYLYSNVNNILLFIEAWRAQGVTKIMVFYQSGTRETRKVLEYYQDLGLVEIMPWPEFGELPKYISDKYPKVDSSVYVSSQGLAQHIAALEIDTDLASPTDFDEILVTESMTAEARVRREFQANKTLGAAMFKRILVQVDPKMLEFDYTSILQPIFLDLPTEPKYVFNTSVVDNLVVHTILSFIDKNIQSVTLKNAACLHYRHNGFSQKSSEIKLNFTIFQDNQLDHLGNIERDLNNIFEKKPKIDPKALVLMEQCHSTLRPNKKCAAPAFYCKPLVTKSEEVWVYEQTPSSQIFL